MDVEAVRELWMRFQRDPGECRASLRFLSGRQVLEKLGPPDSVQVTDKGEQAWHYLYREGQKFRYIVLQIDSGYVVGAGSQ